MPDNKEHEVVSKESIKSEEKKVEEVAHRSTSKKSSNSSLVLLIVALAAVIIAVIIMVVVTQLNNRQETATVNTFISNIDKSDYSAAYDLLSDELKEGVSEASFQAQLPSDRYTNCNFEKTNELIHDDVVIVEGPLKCDGLDAQVSFTFQNDKITSYSIATKGE